MPSHHLRVLVIAVLALAALVGVIVLVALGEDDGVGFGFVSGVLTTLVPALADSLAVERRRRTPGQRAIEDDRE
ncbi:MAG: hypothetical protein ACRCSL_16735 [Microbacterium sp.]